MASPTSACCCQRGRHKTALLPRGRCLGTRCQRDISRALSFDRCWRWGLPHRTAGRRLGLSRQLLWEQSSCRIMGGGGSCELVNQLTPSLLLLSAFASCPPQYPISTSDDTWGRSGPARTPLCWSSRQTQPSSHQTAGPRQFLQPGTRKGLVFILEKGTPPGRCPPGGGGGLVAKATVPALPPLKYKHNTAPDLMDM